MHSRKVVRTTTRDFILVDHALLHIVNRFRKLSLQGRVVRFFLIALPVLAITHAELLPAQGRPMLVKPVCPVSIESSGNSLNVPEYRSYRHSVNGDYVTIEYNAKDNTTTWSDYNRFFDYRGLNNKGYAIDTNGSFLPVIHTKEKIAVRVCGLKFTDVLTVTTGGIGVPEGGADIRGAAPITPVASLSNTLDTLQSGVPTGGATTLPGLGLNAPTALPSLSITGIIPGALGPEDQTPGKYPTYTPASVTASGKQVALLLFSVDRNAAELLRLINRTFGEPYDSKNPIDSSNLGNEDISKAAPGSVNGVMYQLGKTLPSVLTDSTDPANFSAFDKHMTDIQNINAQISTLSSALTTQAFASNTLALLNNYSSLTGILELARLGDEHNNCQSNQAYLETPNLSTLSKDELNKLTIDSFDNWTPAQILSLNKVELDLLPKPPKGSKEQSLEDRVIAMQKALIAAGIKPSTTGLGDKPLCSIFEQNKFKDFWKAYDEQVSFLGNNLSKAQTDYAPVSAQAFCDNTHHRCYEEMVGERLVELKNKLDELRDKLRSIDMASTKLYVTMNEWQARSSVEETDVLPPLTTNAILRISIAVQRGYTPFTLANAGGAITPAVSANVVPSTVAAASTSTPAHSVKTILVEVHRVANFNLMGGVMFIHIPNTTYGVQASPTPSTLDAANTGYDIETCGGQQTLVLAATPAPTYSCIVQTQHTQWQLAAMAGLVWFPWGHDYFPRHSGYENFGRNLLPSLLLATSVSSLGNSMGGVNWEPVSGLDFYAGIGSAHKTVLPSGLTVNTAVPSGYTLTQITQEHAGFTFGVGFDLNVITALFTSKTTSAASMP
jgi:hypothetical protein